jgi:hypothetical protein
MDSSELVHRVMESAIERRDQELAAIGLTWEEAARLSKLNKANYTASDRKKWRAFERWRDALHERNVEFLAGLGITSDLDAAQTKFGTDTDGLE